jgi:hypothetical protein
MDHKIPRTLQKIPSTNHNTEIFWRVTVPMILWAPLLGALLVTLIVT